MALRPIGWICGELVRKFAGQAEIIQRAFLEIMDEIRDEFPNLLRLTSSNQQNDRTVQGSKSVMARVFSSPHAAVVMNGLTRISHSSKSFAKLLRPHILRKFEELSTASHRILKNVNAPKKPLYKIKDTKIFFYDVISYPAKTALTSIMCVSYAALILLAISAHKILGKIKSVIQTDKASGGNSSDDFDADEFLRARHTASEPAVRPTKPASSASITKTSQNSGSIHTLLAAMDQENEQ
uniref:Spermatosis associated 9 n=1 Tax=Salvator merianae TaxID=96440 RepID=A0A8D0DN46_SALMN